MFRRKGMIGLSLLCALLFSALAAQEASAINTTAVTCAPSTNGPFNDAHCDTSGAVSGGFKHVKIAPGSNTYIDATNAKTASETTAHQPAVMILKNFQGIKEFKITCEYITSEGNEAENYIKNVEEAGGAMQVEGHVKLHYGKNTAEPNANCTTNTPGVTAFVPPVAMQFKGVEIAANEMGLKFEPVSGTSFATIKFQGGALEGKEFPLTGSFTGTSSQGPNGDGATLSVIPSMCSLKLGETTAELTQTTTTSMTNGTTTENAIALTTNAA